MSSNDQTADARVRRSPHAPGFEPGGHFFLDDVDGPVAVWGAQDRVLWASGEPLMLAGGPGVGKSTIAANLIRGRIGLQSEFLGLPVEAGSRVAYLACDRPLQIRRLGKRLYRDPEDFAVLNERIGVWSGPLHEDVSKSTDHLLHIAQDECADTIVIDSVKDLLARPSDDDMGTAFNIAVQKCIAEGIEVLIIHHSRKAKQNGASPTKLDDVYGSRWLTAGAGSVVVVDGQPGGAEVRLYHRKQPLAEVGPLHVHIDHHSGLCTEIQTFDVVEYVQQNPSGVTISDMVQASGKKLSDATRKAMKRHIDRYVNTEIHVDLGPGGTQPARYFPI